MARLRLFANLREIAGAPRVEIESDTLGGVIEAASDRFGPEFRRALDASRIWLNGEVASMETPVSATDEVVVLPPVSGGTAPLRGVTTLNDLLVFLPLVALALIVLANLSEGQAFWAAALVGVASAWALDLGAVFSVRGRLFAPVPVAVTCAGAAISTHVLGDSGYALVVPVAVAVSLGWAVAFPDYREIPVAAPVFLVGLIGGLATSSLMLARTPFVPGDQAADVFLVSVVVGLLLGAIVERMPLIPFLDAFSVTALGAVIAAVASAVVWELDAISYLLVGLAIAISLVAGRGFGSMLRMGAVTLTQRSPGTLLTIDSAALAAAVYYPLLRAVL